MRKRSSYARKRRPALHRHYSHWDELMASPADPLPQAWRVHHLTRLWEGLAALETAPNPTTDDWRMCSDAVNFMETLVTQGPWLAWDGTMVEISDHGLLQDAVTALAHAGKRHMATGCAIRLDGPGIVAVRSVLDGYAQALEVLSARAMVRCHRLTEARIADILAGKRQPHDIEVMDL
ncbi:MAG: hypothetical protein N2690_03385 [Rhodocyclaceae bacterium]|nr:hypothetical protein [Rhodocyclaceae bacterium]